MCETRSDMSPPRYLTPDDARRLLTAAEVLTDRGTLWSVAEVTRWMVAKGEKRDGLLCVSTETFHGAFPEVHAMLSASEEAPVAPAPRESQAPAVLTVAKVAELMGWTVKRTRRWLLTAGALEKQGRQWVTTQERLAEVFPAAYRAVVEGERERPSFDDRAVRSDDGTWVQGLELPNKRAA
jgi:hypothetical protein